MGFCSLSFVISLIGLACPAKFKGNWPLSERWEGKMEARECRDEDRRNNKVGNDYGIYEFITGPPSSVFPPSFFWLTQTHYLTMYQWADGCKQLILAFIETY